MVYFTVSKNVNIKIADSTVLKFFKPEDRYNVELDNIYITTYNDIKSIKDIFLRVGDEYKLLVEDEKKFSSLKAIPREIGIENKNEYNILTYGDSFDINKDKIDILSQTTTIKKDIKIAIIGGIGKDIGEMISSLGAIRILKQHLERRYRAVVIDLYIQSSDNKFYIRDKEILKNGIGVNRVFPLPISLKTLCSYDFYIDTSSIEKTYYYKHLPFIDSYLHKFGIDYTKIPNNQKYNKLKYNRTYKPSSELREKIYSLKSRGKVMLFHPFSPDIDRSMPRDIAVKLINKLIKKLPEYMIVSTLKIDGVNESIKDKTNITKDERYEDISSYSKSFFDFAYIISNMDKIITVDTSTYHISNIFFIPTIVISNDKNLIEKRIKYYHSTKAYYLENRKEKSFSVLKDQTPELILNKYDYWKNIKTKKLLNKFKEL